MTLFDVTVNYKSGNSVVLDNMKSFEVKSSGGGREISWERSPFTTNKIILIGVDGVESVTYHEKHRFFCSWF